jgi:phenylalanyl-tRNA synthetase beta chain
MKISLNWLKEYIELSELPEVIGQRLTDTGLEVEGIEHVEVVKGGFQGLVIGEVLTCRPHPNADKLSITTVDIGESAPSQIVCGAANVAAGQKVVVATVNTTLYPTEGEPFKIKKAKIRGEASEGMICAEDEIGLGHSHEGIMVLSTKLPNGTPARQYFTPQHDWIIEIGLTPNRADAASHLGVARDLKAVLKTSVTWPDVDNFKPGKGHPVSVEVENNEACPRYSGITIDGLKVGSSPEWLQKRLRSIGLAPINNVVDITNFVLHETGQPLHAFDADKIAGDKVIVKTLPQGTTFTTLDEKERKLQSDDLMICDGEGKGMCIAGVFGGVHSGVSENTTRIFLESAYFSADYIRKTAQHHKLKTDASFRYERGTDPEITVYALKRAALLMKEIAGGTVVSDITDVYPIPVKPVEVPVLYSHIHRLIGVKLEKDTIASILQDLDITLTSINEEGFTAIVPPYRTDVTREADIIEEILRIYGLNQIDLPEFVASDYLADFPAVDPDKTQGAVSQLLVANGFYEVITNSLTRPGYAENHAFLDASKSVEIVNKLSEDLGVMRQSLLFSMLEVAQHNINRRQPDLRLFEFGKQYFHEENNYREEKRLGLLVTGNMVTENWAIPSRKTTFHDLAGAVTLVMQRLSRQQLSPVPYHEDPYQYGLQFMLGNKKVAVLGKVSDTICRKQGLKQEVFFADIDWEQLLKESSGKVTFSEVPKFPEVRRDLSLVIDKSVSFSEIEALAYQNERKLLKDMQVFDVYEGSSIGDDKKAYAINFTLQDTERTLQDKVIDKTMSRLMQAFEKELNALIRK